MVHGILVPAGADIVLFRVSLLINNIECMNKQCPECKSFKTYSDGMLGLGFFGGGGCISGCGLLFFPILIFSIPIMIFGIFLAIASLFGKKHQYLCQNCNNKWSE